MKKTLFGTLALVILMLFAACNAESVNTKYKTVSVNFKAVREESSKSLTSSCTSFDKDAYYWRYSATKKDSGSTTGVTSETNVKASGTGLGSLDGQFATGKWTFTLFAYADSGFTKKVFTGSVDKTFTGTNPVESITVSVGPLSEASGTLLIGKLDPETAINTTPSQIAYIVGGTVNTSYTDFPTTVSNLTSGTYTVKIELWYDTFKTASEAIQVTIYDNLTTIISGTVDEITSHVTLDANDPVTVTFDTKGGSSIASQQIVQGGYATTPSNPTKDGYVFGGWTTDSNAYTTSTDFDFTNTPVTADTTIYAIWRGYDYYTIKGGLNYSSLRYEWLEGFGINYNILEENYPEITEIEFVKKNPETFKNTISYTTECNLSSNSNLELVKGYTNGTKIWIVGEHITANPNCKGMFAYFTELTTITNLNYLDTSNVTDMTGMFCYCQSLSNLDFSNFDTSKVTNMYQMFYFCKNLTYLDFSSFDTSNVTNLCYMFNSCYLLESINLSSFNTSKVTDMSGMFENCYFTTLDLSSFNTSEVTYYSEMFYESGATGATITINTDYESLFNSVLSGWTHTTGSDLYTKPNQQN